MKRGWSCTVLALGAAALVGACAGDSGDDAPDVPAWDPALVAYLDETFGLRMYGWHDPVDQPTRDADGFLTTNVEVDGFGARAIAIEQRVQPVAAGGELFVQIRDVESDEQRFFLYDFDESYIVFGEDTSLDGSRGAGVQRNPDGTFDVWTFDDAVSDRTEVVTVPDGYAAMRRVDAVNRFGELSPHIVMAAFALGHTPTPESRISTFCSEPITAFTPAVCSIFKAFCDCVACRVLDRGGACDLCPEL